MHLLRFSIRELDRMDNILSILRDDGIPAPIRFRSDLFINKKELMKMELKTSAVFLLLIFCLKK